MDPPRTAQVERVPTTGSRTDDATAREAQILELVPLVRGLARRYANRGEPLDDVVQAGMVGLIKAVDRFDATRGTDLVTFATPTILGEIRRHFRDHTWGIHVPRSLQEAHHAVARAVDELTTRLGRSPSVREVAEEMELSEEDVLEAMAVRTAYRPGSLSAPRPGAEEDEPVEVGVEDQGYEQATARAALGGLARLPARERVILHLRFEEGLTQSEIAARVGISQMHVSRLIQRALGTLREMAERRADRAGRADSGVGPRGSQEATGRCVRPPPDPREDDVGRL